MKKQKVIKPKTPSLTKIQFSQASQKIITWYRSVRRDLPWRMNRDPYRIWISEVMLQQTTVAAVVPYFERFIKRFPTLASLAKSAIEDVLEHWAGLGYYSRARNLHKASQHLHKNGFPQTHAELLELPGFGPYTARAVASLAFGEKTGVLDGNVIRVLSRYCGLSTEWWKPQGRHQLQMIADELAQVTHPEDLNQGLMELGATICTPQAPACLLCPLTKSCVARETQKITDLPLKKPRRTREIWLWQPMIIEDKGKILLVPNHYAPFLKGHWILPGSTERVTKSPKSYDYKGTVTHHDIFVSVKKSTLVSRPKSETKWVSLSSLEKEIPASLIRKAIDHALQDRDAK